MIDRKEVEICSQPHKMYAEGCHGDKPTIDDITDLLEREGFCARGSVDIWLDTSHGLWRWICDISIKPTSHNN